MGQAQSASADGKTPGLVKIIDFVAANLILTQDFQDLQKLSSPEYCDKLVIMTSDVLNNYLDSKEVEYLFQKMEGNVEVNQMRKEKLTYFEKDNIAKLDLKSPLEKKRACIGIAKTYVKIAHLFSAIMTTVNPVYSYTDSHGMKVKVPLNKKNEIPEGANAKLTRSNICSQRIAALVGSDKSFVGATAGSEDATIKPNFCSLNMSASGSKTLSSEPGIPELKRLYYDVYDFETGGYKSMSEKSRKQYESDVQNMYKVFSGSDSVPSNVKSFSDIKLKDFHNSKGCATNGVYKRGYQMSTKDKLYIEYSEHVQNMMKRAEDNQNKLLTVIDNIFAYSVNPNTLKKEIRVSPSLNSESLQQIVEETRNIIMGIYVQCETDFTKGLDIFESIVEKQMMDTATARVDHLRDRIQEELAVPMQTPTEESVTKPKEAVDLSKSVVPEQPSPSDDSSLEKSNPSEESEKSKEIPSTEVVATANPVEAKPQETKAEEAIVAPVNQEQAKVMPALGMN